MLELNDLVVKITRFPNNEVLIKDNLFIIKKDVNIIKVKFESNEDFLNLMFIKKHVDERYPHSKTILIIPYLPYSRMDRTEGEAVFTLKYICDFINMLKFDKVVTHEAHSNVSLALLDRIENINYSVNLANKCIQDIEFNKEEDYIVFPDEGARKRYKKDFSDCKILTCEKQRDFTTGKISDLKINEPSLKPGFKAIIVDDLCSYGGTFMLASQTLKELGAKEIYLCVTHSEDGLFLGNIFKTNFIDKVYTTNSIIDLNRVRINPEATILKDRINIYNIF